MPTTEPTFEQVTDGAWVLRHNRDSGLPVVLLRAVGKGWGLFAARRIAKGEDVALYKLRVMRRARFDTERVVGWRTTQVAVDGQGRVAVGGGAAVPALWEGGVPPPAGTHAVVRLRGAVDTVELEGGHTFVNPLLHQDGYSCEVYDLTRPTGTNGALIANVYGGSVPRARRGVPFWGHFANEPDPGQLPNVECLPDRGCKPSPRPGDTIVHRLVATRDVPAGAELVWYYGDDYDREYTSAVGHAPRLWRAVGVEAQRGDATAREYRVRWSDGRRSWEPKAKLERGEGVRLLNAWRAATSGSEERR